MNGTKYAEHREASYGPTDHLRSDKCAPIRSTTNQGEKDWRTTDNEFRPTPIITVGGMQQQRTSAIVNEAVEAWSKKDTRTTTPIFRPVTFWRNFVAPRSERYVIVDVHIDSPLAKPASTQSQ